MKYVSIDIETTGLDPVRRQILEFAAVKSTGEVFQRYIKHDTIIGDPYALALNHKILDNDGIRIGQLLPDFVEWLNASGKVLAAGKNFGSFDLQFLGPDFKELFHHAYLDPGMLYFDPKVDVKIPNLTVCLERAGMKPTELHTAKGDALDVHYLIEAYYRR